MTEMVEYPRELREVIEGYAMVILAEGRPGWDVPHTLAVVRWAYELALENSLDVKVVVTAAYLHDVGYYGLFEESEVAGLTQVMNRKERHMVVGAEMVKRFLEGVEGLTEVQKARVVHLVGIHDKVGELNAVDELVLMEADSLGAIDVDWVEPTYKGIEALDYLDTRMIKRRARFITPMAMDAYDRLAERFRDRIMERDFDGREIDRWEAEGGSSGLL